MKHKLRHYFPTVAALALVATTAAGQDLPAVKPPDKADKIKFPLEKPRNVVKFDATGIRDVPWHVQAVKAPEAWAKNPAAKGKGIVVAILDTGVQKDHPGLDGKVIGTYSAITKKVGDAADGHGHGTHCAGIVHSIAPEASLFAIKVLSDDGSGSVDDIAHGIDYAVNVVKADVISLSLGGPSPDPFQPAAIKRAVAAGVVVVCAAGNDGGPADTEGYPGRYADSISVAASDRNGRLANFSSWGPNVFTVDPGVDILSTLPVNNEGLMSGTSMATPCEAGKVASWIASNAIPKDANRRDAYRKAALGAMPFPERTNARGYGLYTLDKVTGTAAPAPKPPAPGKPVAVTITFADLSPAKQAELQAGGVTTFRLEVGHAVKPTTTEPAPPPIPVQAVPVPGQWQPPAQPWYPPQPQPVPQYMPGPCPGGVCPVPQSSGGWVPGQVIRRVFR